MLLSIYLLFQVYLQLHDHPISKNKLSENEENISPMELKKMSKKEKQDVPKKKNADEDLDGPLKEELIPGKLEMVSDGSFK